MSFMNTVMDIWVPKTVENFVSEWLLDPKGGRFHGVIPLTMTLSESCKKQRNLIIWVCTLPWRKQWRNRCMRDATITTVDETAFRCPPSCHCYHQCVINMTRITALALPWTGQMAPNKAVRYHGQVKWHQVRMYVTMGRSNGTKQGCTLPRAGQMAPSKAVRYHGQVKWHQATLYVTTDRSNGTKQGCTLPWTGQMAPSKAVRYHGQVKWHPTKSLYLPVTKKKLYVTDIHRKWLK
jgi:hypothetical protein